MRDSAFMHVGVRPKPRRKSDGVTQALLALGRKRGPDGKLPTLQEMGEQYAVSRTTLETALESLERRGLIRRKHGSGIYVTPRIAQKSIGLVFGHNIFDAGDSPFYALLMRRCRERARSHGERFSFFIDPLPEEVGAGAPPVHPDLADAIASEKLHGILLTARNSEAEETWLRAQNVPVVSLGFVEDGPPPAVSIDHKELIRLGVSALAAQGCRRIGLITPHDPDSSVGAGQIRSFRDALQRRHLGRDDAWVWSRTLAPARVGATRDDHGARAFKTVFGGSGRVPDGLVITDDMLTRGLLLAAGTAGLQVGRDLRIATHANTGSPVLTEWADRVTRVEVDPDDIVDAMLGMLERLMMGEAVEEQTVVVKPVIRPA